MTAFDAAISSGLTVRTSPPYGVNNNPNVQTILSALETILEPDSVAELRIPNTARGTVSGYFKDFTRLAEETHLASGTAPGVYVTLNPVKPDLWARAADRVLSYAKHTTSDTDIVRRRWLPLDFDPKRPSGISATDAEHEAALQRAEHCCSFLAELGWPDPVEADSGNGAHLLYRIDLPNDETATDLVKRCLSALDLKFSDEVVSVDQATCNAARIWKVYGTVAAKGDSTSERPHRIARILHKPERLGIVTLEQLNALAAMCPAEPPSAPKSQRRSNFDLDTWIQEHDLPVVREGVWKGQGRKLIMNPCPWNEAHTNESAYIVQFPSGAIAAGCHHNGCTGENWHSLKKLYGGDTNATGERDAAFGRGERQNSQAEQLMRFAEAAELFHTKTGEPYATILVDSHRETWPVSSKQFREWLLHQFYRDTGNIVAAPAVKEAINLCEAKARFDGTEIPVFTRIAEFDGNVYLDLADADWTVVEIDESGWRVRSDCPVKFHRTRGTVSLPLPMHGGSAEELRRFINVGSESDWKLLVSWLVAALRPRGPYPILVLHGEQGSAKSTTARMLRSLIDPNSADLRSEPRGIQDVMIAAKNGWVVSFDNLSSLPVWLSDALCRLSTGGGFSTRQLYSDTDEILIEAQRPSILNGIEELASRGDLLDRSLVLYLPSIAEKERRAEHDLWRDFRVSQPRILGALLTAVSGAMTRLSETTLSALPRLADFALWVSAAERSLGWNDGDFMQSYTSNRSSANDLTLDASPVAHAIRQSCPAYWQGTSTELLDFLNSVTDEGTRKQKSWPASNRSLSNELRRLAPNLRNMGTEVEFGREANSQRRRLIIIRQSKTNNETNRSANPSGNDQTEVCCESQGQQGVQL